MNKYENKKVTMSFRIKQEIRFDINDIFYKQSNYTIEENDGCSEFLNRMILAVLKPNELLSKIAYHIDKEHLLTNLQYFIKEYDLKEFEKCLNENVIHLKV